MRASHLILRMCLTIAVFCEPSLLLAQSSNKSTSTKPSTSGLKDYEKGARSFEKGKYETAVASLTSSLSAGGLTSQQMAKALYYRGLAYRKQGKNALAISDLTSAIWLKSGLSDTERAVAIDQRQAAYREAGLGDGIAMGSVPMDGPTTYKNPAQSGDSMQPVTTAAVSSSDRSSTSWTTASSPSPSNSEFHSSYTSATQRSSDLATSKKVGEGAVSSTVSQPVNTPKSVDQISITNAENIYSNSVSGTPSSQNVTEEPALSTLVGLIENIFGSGTSTENKASSEEGNALATSSTKQIIMTPISQPIVSDWNTTVANTNKRNSPTIKDQMKPTTSTLSEKTKGKYRLQVAVLRSRNKAEDIASELRKKYGNDLGSAVTAIDEVVYGNMGKFYRLQLGPYANAAAAGNFCNVLKPQGYDCMVVTQ